MNEAKQNGDTYVIKNAYKLLFRVALQSLSIFKSLYTQRCGEFTQFESQSGSDELEA